MVNYECIIKEIINLNESIKRIFSCFTTVNCCTFCYTNRTHKTNCDITTEALLLFTESNMKFPSHSATQRLCNGKILNFTRRDIKFRIIKSSSFRQSSVRFANNGQLRRTIVKSLIEKVAFAPTCHPCKCSVIKSPFSFRTPNSLFGPGKMHHNNCVIYFTVVNKSTDINREQCLWNAFGMKDR